MVNNWTRTQYAPPNRLLRSNQGWTAWVNATLGQLNAVKNCNASGLLISTVSSIAPALFLQHYYSLLLQCFTSLKVETVPNDSMDVEAAGDFFVNHFIPAQNWLQRADSLFCYRRLVNTKIYGTLKAPKCSTLSSLGLTSLTDARLRITEIRGSVRCFRLLFNIA